MPRMSTVKLTKRVVDGLAVERGDRVFYDRDLTGFGVRVYASGRKVYVVHARAPGLGLRRTCNRTVPQADLRVCAPPGRGGYRSDQEGRGSVSGAAGAGANGGRPGGALHRGASESELPPGDGRDLRSDRSALYPAGVRAICPCRRWSGPMSRRCTTRCATSPTRRIRRETFWRRCSSWPRPGA